MNNLNNVVEAIFVVPDVSIVQPGSTEIFFYIISNVTQSFCGQKELINMFLKLKCKVCHHVLHVHH